MREGGTRSSSEKNAAKSRHSPETGGRFGRMIGIFTERDLMRAVAGRVHSSEARVREWMTPDPVTMTEDASVEEAGQTMVERGFRHIPVVAGERAVGIVSIRDVAEWRLKER